MSGYFDAAKQEELKQVVKNAFKSYPDFPKPGILFHDIFGVFGDPLATQES